MTEYLPLFEAMGLPPVKTPAWAQTPSRQTFIDEALERQKAEFREAFRAFLRAYTNTHEGFLAADVITAYRASNHPQPIKDFRCVGGIFQAAINRGELRSIGTRKAADGTGRNMDAYRRGTGKGNDEITF